LAQKMRLLVLWCRHWPASVKVFNQIDSNILESWPFSFKDNPTILFWLDRWLC